MRITITGANGYLGWVLVPLLVDDGHYVSTIDVRQSFAFPKSDMLIHLAAMTNYNNCQSDQDNAWKVNYWLTDILNQLRDCPMIFASSLSVYGKLYNELICDEEVSVNPQTVYAQTKAKAEELLLRSGNAIILRLATGFGVSPKMRWDVMPNNFVLKSVTDHHLDVYEGDALRSFFHIYDIASAFQFAVQNYPSMSGGVYNIGNESLNFTKRSLAEKVKAKTDCQLEFKDGYIDPDGRDYYVSFEKIRRLGFSPLFSLDQGLDQLIQCLS